MHTWQHKIYLRVTKNQKESSTLAPLFPQERKDNKVVITLSGQGRTTQDIENEALRKTKSLE